MPSEMNDIDRMKKPVPADLSALSGGSAGEEEIEIPSKAAYIIGQLEANGYEAFIVGGCVRDSFLGREPGDWDITTSASPAQVKQIFPRTIDTGIEHGTVTVMIGKDGYEVTTYRVDGDYADHRHPDTVRFTGSLMEDLSRRDFTMNAMAYSPERGLADPYGGLEDLKQGRIRCVGCAADRFEEDALRILRALRFAAQLGFEIEDQTAQAMTEKASTLTLVSAERIRSELVKILVSPAPQKLHEGYKLGITAVVLPEYDQIVGLVQQAPKHLYTVDEHTLRAVKNIAPLPHLRLTMLFHDMGKPEVLRIKENGKISFPGHAQVSERIARDIMKRLKFDNHTIDVVTRLVKWHSTRYEASPVAVRQLLYEMGDDIFEDFLQVQRADIQAKNPQLAPKKLAVLDEKERIYREVRSSGDCYCIRMLAVNGKDLMTAGIPKGPQIGQVLRRLTEYVIVHPQENDRKLLLALAGEWMENGRLLEWDREERQF